MMKSRAGIYSVVFAVSLANCLIYRDLAGSPPADVDLSAAIPLVAQPIAPLATAGSPKPAGIRDPSADIQIHSLFTRPPGTWVSMAAMGGAVDPVGTNLAQDFDGDGLLNANETTTNPWVADYPMVEASIAPPVTMRIEILKTSGEHAGEIVSEINSDDLETTKNQGSERVHRNEVNERTVQFQDSIARKTETKGGSATGSSRSVDGSISTPVFSAGGGGSSSNKSEGSWSRTSEFNSTTTKWADRPFKNNLDRTASSLKADSAARKARKFRTEKSGKTDISTVIKSDAGLVRAALYIKNQSVNMPVRISNVLCSLVFETPTGESIPVQSFRLRNDDYSMFQIDVYGGQQFGPYVVELSNLNTAEIERAIGLGYTPKIHIVDYEMTHVPDSNYRSLLLNYSGNNLKVVEENAKGRTAVLKVIGPGIREIYRIAAFATDSTDVCRGTGATTFTPGVSLRVALERLACSGVTIEFEDYVLDLSEAVPGLVESKVFVRGIKRYGGISSNLPCVPTSVPVTGSDSQQRNACVQTLPSTWTPEQIETTGVWVVFANGKYYSHSEYITDGGTIRTFNSPAAGEQPIPMLAGVDSRIWVGDQYDLIYLRAKDLMASAHTFGTNPLETGEPQRMTTRWNLTTVTDNPFYPRSHSTFLGQAGLGDRVELTFILRETLMLNPDFGPNRGTGVGAPLVFDAFSYDRKLSTRRYTLPEAIDFEVSLGLGGTYGDWFNIRRDTQSGAPDGPSLCGESLDFTAQVYTVCLQLPQSHPLVSDDLGMVSLYIRPALNSAYRETIWPMPYTEVKRFRGALNESAISGAATIRVGGASGTLNPGDALNVDGEAGTFSVSALSLADGVYTVQLSGALSADRAGGTEVGVNAGLSESQFVFYVPDGYFAEWNQNYSLNPAYSDMTQNGALLEPGSAADVPYCSTQFSPAKCLGYAANLVASNWIGYNNLSNPFWNSWADSSHLGSFLQDAWRHFLVSRGTAARNEVLRASPEMELFPSDDSANSYSFAREGALALAVFRTPANELRALRIQSDTGVSIGSRIDLPGPDLGLPRVERPAVALAGGRAIVARQRLTLNPAPAIVYPLEAHVVDMNSGLVVGPVMQFDGSSTSDKQIQVAAVVAAGGLARAMVVFRNPEDGWRVYAQVIDLFGGNSFGPLLSLSQSSSTVRDNPQVVMGPNGTALVVWQEQAGSSTDIRGRFVNYQDATLLGTDFPVSTTNAGDQTAARMAITGDRVIAVWESTHGGDRDIRGRVFDLGSGLSIGAGDVGISLTNGGEQILPTAYADAGRALVVWQSNAEGTFDIHGRVVDLVTGLPLGNQDLAISTHNANTQDMPEISGWGVRSLVTWRSNDRDVARTDIRGRVVDLVTTKPLESSDFSVNTSVDAGSSTPLVTVYNNRALVIWGKATGPTFDLRVRALPIDFPMDGADVQFGLNNFFTAPLIERTFDIKARIKSDR